MSLTAVVKKILVTGGTGLLGSNWADSINHKIEVILGFHNRHIEKAGTTVVSVVLENELELLNTVSRLAPDVVVHCAALTNIEECEKNSELAENVNVFLAKNVTNVCSNLGIKFVYISTDQLFDGHSAYLNEGTPTNPLNTYGKTKASAEKYITIHKPEALIIRTNFFGWGTSYRESFSDFIISGLRRGREMHLFSDVYFTPILIEELVAVTHELLDKSAAGIFHVVSAERVSKYEFGLMLAQEFELDSTLITPCLITDRADLVKRPLDMSLSNEKVSRILGHKLRNLREQMADLRESEK